MLIKAYLGGDVKGNINAEGLKQHGYSFKLSKAFLDYNTNKLIETLEDRPKSRLERLRGNITRSEEIDKALQKAQKRKTDAEAAIVSGTDVKKNQEKVAAADKEIIRLSQEQSAKKKELEAAKKEMDYLISEAYMMNTELEKTLAQMKHIIDKATSPTRTTPKTPTEEQLIAEYQKLKDIYTNAKKIIENANKAVAWASAYKLNRIDQLKAATKDDVIKLVNDANEKYDQVHRKVRRLADKFEAAKAKKTDFEREAAKTGLTPEDIAAMQNNFDEFNNARIALLKQKQIWRQALIES